MKKTKKILVVTDKAKRHLVDFKLLDDGQIYLLSKGHYDENNTVVWYADSQYIDYDEGLILTDEELEAEF